MSGASLECLAFIQDSERVESFLLASGSSGGHDPLWKVTPEDEWAWNEDSDSGEPIKSPTSTSGEKEKKTWIQTCVVAASPVTDVLVLCRNRKAVFLASEWDSSTGQSKYVQVFQGELSQDGETITTAVYIPLMSSKKSSSGAPDWTCVAIGFSDGYIRMYTETGNILMGQMFHDEAVSALKCHSYRPATFQNEHDQLEELYIVYKTVIVTIEGFGLFQTLRGLRSRIARVQANVPETADAPQLAYKKWQYESQAVADCESVGMKTPSVFDNLWAASVIGGLKAKPSKVPLTSTVFVTVGSKPYTSFHYAQEGQAPFMIGKLAFSVANRLTSGLLSAASGWLGFGGGGKGTGGGGTPGKQEKPKIEPANTMHSRFSLHDKGRKGNSILLSPCHKLSAISDSLGRILLMDNERGIIVRMWKGYREAQIAWMLVNDDMTVKSRVSGRKALFLVIYAPRKGQIEVFTMQQGPKVVTIPVTKSGSLVSIPHGIMGSSNILHKGANLHSVSCLFLNSEGQFSRLQVPFHLSLTDTNNSKLKDMHLLKSLQRLLRDSGGSVTAPDINAILYEVKTQPMINQSFKILVQYSKREEIISSVLDAYLEKFCDSEVRDLSVPFKIQELLHLYMNLENAMKSPPEYSQAGGESSSENTVLLCLHATNKEIKLVKDMANKELFNKKTSTKSVKFETDCSIVGVDMFFGFFNMDYDLSKNKSTSFADDERKLHINEKSDDLDQFGKLLLCGCFNNESNLPDWEKHVRNCELVPSELLKVTLRYWRNNALSSSSFIVMMGRLYRIIRSLCELEGTATLAEETCSWWDSIRREIARGNNCFYNYTFALVCRAVSIDLTQEKIKQTCKIEKKNKRADQLNPSVTPTENEEESSDREEVESEDDADEEGWENVSLDMIKWNVLLKQIEDLSFLSTILNQRPVLTSPSLPTLPVTVGELSVVALLDKGPGCIAELVGNWLTTIGIDPSLIVDSSEKLMTGESSHQAEYSSEYTEKELKKKQKAEGEGPERMEVDEATQLESSTSLGSEVNQVSELLLCLKENFLVSLNSSIILCNYCWEYCLAWNLEVENVHFLAAAIRCVAVIPSPSLKQGIMSMMWSTFLQKQLVNIVGRGKVRREKVLDKTVVIGGSENRITFLKECVSFLDDFMETCILCQTSRQTSKISTKKNHWTSGSSTASLSDLALMQPLANYEMILLHYQLAVVSWFVFNFNIRKTSMRPMNLFDTKGNMTLFSEIASSIPYSNVEVDLALKVLREEFLCLVVTNIVERIPEDDDSPNIEEGEEYCVVPSASGIKESDEWMHKCFELGRTWGLDLDSLRINQVCELYSSGYDLLALESIGAVSAKDILGSKLMVVAGMRLHYYIQSNRESATEIMSSMSTNLSNWLNKLDYSKLRCLRFGKSSIVELARQIMTLIPDSSYDHKLAEDLLICSTFLSS